MSMVTASKKRKRVYQRKFDHDLCREMYASGEYSVPQLAEHFNVTSTSVRKVVDPEFGERMSRKAREWLKAHPEKVVQYSKTGVCAHCGEKTWKTNTCMACRRSPGLVKGLALCTKCKTWKKAEDFRVDQNRWWRGFLVNNCRSCESAGRRSLRQLPPRLCSFPGCDVYITTDSRTGRCRSHAHHSETHEIFGT